LKLLNTSTTGIPFGYDGWLWFNICTKEKGFTVPSANNLPCMGSG
jgi:hypothetical protein